MEIQSPQEDHVRLELPPAPHLKMDVVAGTQSLERFARLLNHSFNVPASGGFLDDFPIWDERFGPRAEKLIRIGVWDGDELVSSAGVRLAQLQAPTGQIAVALIGAVATAETHRGRGLASRTVSLAVEWARERGAALAILWGSELNLYERLGFELCGTQVRVPLIDLKLGAQAFPVGKGWHSSLLTSMQRRGSGLKLEPSDARWLSQHKNVQWYWIGTPESPQAYAAVGRGIDLGNLVHEWGGQSPEALHSLLAAVRAEHPSAQLLASPSMLEEWGIQPTTPPELEFLCLARALDLPKLLAAYAVKLAPGDPLLDTPNAAVCRLFFGPGTDALPLWIWGLDAV